ncbi:MAG: hypothetical protein ACOC9X_01320 [bacterium]
MDGDAKAAVQRIEQKVDTLIVLVRGSDDHGSEGLVNEVKALKEENKARQAETSALKQRMDSWSHKAMAFASGLGAGSGGLVAWLLKLLSS